MAQSGYHKQHSPRATTRTTPPPGPLQLIVLLLCPWRRCEGNSTAWVSFYWTFTLPPQVPFVSLVWWCYRAALTANVVMAKYRTTTCKCRHACAETYERHVLVTNIKLWDQFYAKIRQKFVYHIVIIKACYRQGILLNLLCSLAHYTQRLERMLKNGFRNW